MQSKTLSLNKALFNNLSRQIVFLTVINLIGTFILIPFSYVLVRITDGGYTDSHIQTVGVFSGFTQLFLFGTTCYAVLCGVFLTNYLKSQQASDFFHSLPLKRGTILLTTIIVFCVHQALNLIVNGLLCVIFKSIFHEITFHQIFVWMMMTIYLSLFIFAVTLLLGLFINNAINHFIFSVLVILGPLLISSVVQLIQSFFFDGLIDFQNTWAEQLTVPMQMMNRVTADASLWTYCLIVMMVTIILFALSFMIYSRRKNENINEGYSSRWAQIVLYCFAITLGTLYLGAVGLTIFPETPYITFIWFVLDFLILFYIVEMISQQAVRIIFNKKLFAISLGFVLLSLIAVFVSGQYREKYFPAVDQVTSATVQVINAGQDGEVFFDQPVKNDDYKKAVINLHRYLYDHRVDSEMDSVQVSYRLKNGLTVNRSYYASKQGIAQLKELQNNEDYYQEKVNSFNWDKLLNNDITVSQYSESGSDAGFSKNIKASQKKELIAALKQDMQQVDPDSLTVQTAESNTTLDFQDNSAEGGYLVKSVSITPYHHHVLQYLVKAHIINRPSDIYLKGSFLKLKDSKKLDTLSYIDPEVVEELPRQQADIRQVRQLIDDYQADIHGADHYLFDEGGNSSLYSVFNVK